MLLCEERDPYELARTWYKHLPPCFLICQYQRDSTGKRIGPVVVRCKRKVNQLLHELRIITIPGIEKSELAVGVIRLNRLYAGELWRGIPDELVGNGDPGSALPFAQYELEAVGLAFTSKDRGKSKKGA